MSELLAEVLLRGSKLIAATLLGAAVYAVLVGPFGVAGSPVVALLAWLVGGVAVLLVESSPI